MKKILLGTSALIGAAAFATSAFAGDAEVTVSGTVEFQYNYTDNDQDNDNDHGDIAADNGNTALIVKAKYKADNGLKYGAHIDYRVASSGLDEGYIWVSGDWGEVRLGDDDGVMDAKAEGGEVALAATGGYDGNFLDNVNLPSGFAATTEPATNSANSDDSKITYYSPNFSGFSAGVSYTPNDGGGTRGAVTGSDEDIVEIAGQYNGEIEGVAFNLNGGYRFGDATATGVEDISAYEIGGHVSYAGFILAAGYGDDGDSKRADGLDSEFWTVGLGYDFGAGSVGIGYMNAEADTSATTEDELEVYSLTGTYKVASGLTAFAEVNFIGIEQSGVEDRDATSFILGSRVKF